MDVRLEGNIPERLIRDCECWEHKVSLIIMEKEFPPKAILHIYCPSCSQGIRKDNNCMAENNGWVMQYDPKLLSPPEAVVSFFPHLSQEKCFLVYYMGKKAGPRSKR